MENSLCGCASEIQQSVFGQNNFGQTFFSFRNRCLHICNVELDYHICTEMNTEITFLNHE